MQQHEREYLLYRILSGYVKYTTQGLTLKIYYPRGNIIYEGNEIYCNSYKEAKEDGVLTDEDMIGVLIKEGSWSTQKELELKEIIPKHIEYWKKELYQAFFRSEDRKTMRKYLATAKAEFTRLATIRNTHYHNTCEGVASYSRVQFFIENMTKYRGKKYHWTSGSSALAMASYQESIVEDSLIRELARTPPWYNIWYSGKKISNIFGVSAINLTSEQTRLVSYSAMYDNIHEHQNCPSDEVIEDDDSLDGWMLIQKEEKLNKTVQNNAEGMLNSKVSNSDEIYLIAQNKEDAKKIDLLNKPQARNIKKRRFETIKKHGNINDIMLPDMQQKLAIQINQAQMNKTKSNFV